MKGLESWSFSISMHWVGSFAGFFLTHTYMSVEVITTAFEQAAAF
jgi:hypothetical protein